MDSRILENLSRLGLRASQLEEGRYEHVREDELDVPECILELMFDIPWNDEGPFFSDEGDSDRVEVIFQGPEEFDSEEDPDVVEEYGELFVMGTLVGSEQLLVYQAEDALDDPVFYCWDPEAAGSGESLSEIGDFDSLLSSLYRHATDPEGEDELGDLPDLSDIDFESEDDLEEAGA